MKFLSRGKYIDLVPSALIDDVEGRACSNRGTHLVRVGIPIGAQSFCKPVGLQLAHVGNYIDIVCGSRDSADRRRHRATDQIWDSNTLQGRGELSKRAV